jgi:hypothetical protein
MKTRNAVLQGATLGTCSQVQRFELFKDGTEGWESVHIELYSLPVRGMFKLIVIKNSYLFNSPDVDVVYGELSDLNEQADKTFYAYEKQGFIAPRSTYCGQAIEN